MTRFLLSTLLAAALAIGCSSSRTNGGTSGEDPGVPTPASDDETTASSEPFVSSTPSRAGAPMRSPDDFADLTGDARSQALFTEVGAVFQHPRCTNCHPNGDRPLQGDGLPHHPLVDRNGDGHGAPGMACTTCHGPDNYLGLPGDPAWHLAPREMAWEGKSLPEICAQLKDPARNGGLDLDGLVAHVENDSLVAYGWRPPAHLEPAPGSQAEAAALLRAWADSGAVCPD